MKILYLTHPESDFGEYYLFNGLCKVIGDNNVVTFPFKKSYYGLIDDDYILDDGKTGYTAPGDFIIAKPKNEWSFEDIVNRITEFDIIILSSPRTYAVETLRKIIKEFGKCPLPLIFCDHEDGENIRTDIIEEFSPSITFKRELLVGKYFENIYPLPFSSANDSFPEVNDQEKEYSIFASFGMTWPLRMEVVEKIISLGYKDSYIGLDTKIRGDYQENNEERLCYKDYLIKIAKAKIGLVVRGHGRDTVRQWEVPGYETMMLICDQGLQIPNNFEDGKHAVYFKEDLSDLKEKIDYYLQNDEERKIIAKNGHEHMLKYHTNKARAEYFINILMEKKII